MFLVFVVQATCPWNTASPLLSEFWRQSPVLERVYDAIDAHADCDVHDAALEALHSIARISGVPSLSLS